MSPIVQDYVQRRETINRLREQLPEIHRRVDHLKTIMMNEVGATPVMASLLESSTESLSKLGHVIATEENRLVGIFQSFTEEQKNETRS